MFFVTATLTWWLTGTTVTGGPSVLALSLPEGAVAAARTRVLCEVTTGGVRMPGLAWVLEGEGTLTLARLDGAAFADGALDVSGQIVLALEG